MRKKLVAFITLLALLTAAVPAYAFSYVIRVSGGNAAVFGGAAYILTFNAVRSENGDVTVNIKDKEGNLLGSAGATAGEGTVAIYSAPIVMPEANSNNGKIKVYVEKIVPEGAEVKNVRLTIAAEDILKYEESVDGKVYIMGNIGGTSQGELKLYVVKNGEEYEYTNADKLLYEQDLNVAANTSFKTELDTSGITKYLTDITLVLRGLKSYGYAVDGTVLDFVYKKTSMREEIISSIRAAESAEKIKEILDVKDDSEWPNMRVLELDTVGIVNDENDTEVLGRYFFENREEISPDTIRDIAVRACILDMAAKKKDEKTYAGYIDEYKDSIGFSAEEYTPYSKLYAEMTEDMKIKAVKKLYENYKPSAIDEFKKAFANAVIIAEIAEKANYVEIIDVLGKVQKYIGIDFSKYTLSDSAKLAIANYAKSTNDVFGIGGQIPKLIENSGEKDSGGSTGGGSGSGKSGSGGSSTGGSSGTSISGTPTIVSKPQQNGKPLFSDINDAAWAKDYIEKMAEKKILNGYEDGSFKPNNSITREEFSKIVSLAFGIYSAEAECGFDDVSKGDWSYKYIASLSENNIVTGSGNGSFDKTGNITRQDMAVILDRIAQLKGINAAAEENAFSDKSDISEYACESVLKMAKLGIMTGRGDGRFEPTATATRAETAKVIYALLELTGR